MDDRSTRPPSVDALARTLSGLPHPLLVDAAREAIAAGASHRAQALVDARRRALHTEVVNATGVLLHTNLGRAPYDYVNGARPRTVEFDLDTGERSTRQRPVGTLLARLCGAEAAIVVNNNAAAVLLVVAALAAGRSVAVSRGESVEIGGSFRVPEVMAQSGASLVDVGTTNRTRLNDYRKAIEGHDVALVLKVHPSNYRIEGFVESCSVAELAGLEVPVAVDLGSGLVDATCPWLTGPPPSWLQREPAARQTLAAGASLVTFSGDKLFGGPQAGIICGRADVVECCARHPLARAVRPGGMVLGAMQQLCLTYLARDGASIPFWRMATTPVAELARRANAVTEAIGPLTGVAPVATQAVCGAGSTPGMVIDSAGVAVPGDMLAVLRLHDPPVIARVHDDRTVLDMRTVEPGDDHHLVSALRGAAQSRS
ncbi:L-seryl-tRNA(Sec) selenium transferase [soil metagenome]